MTITGGRLIRAMLDDEDGHSESTNVLHFCVEGNLRMNERIRELIKQCEDYGSWDNKTYSFDKEKFAELIVKECIEQGDTLAKHYIDTHPEQEQAMLLASIADYSNVIKKHFGVGN